VGGLADRSLYAEDMSKTIQVRDVPEQVHGILKARAAREGISLSEFLKRGTGAFGGTPERGGMVGTHREDEADSVEAEWGTSGARVAGSTVKAVRARLLNRLITVGG
jgi:hypothetical protein